ncbi:MAG: hypothetical protein Q8880_06460 [Bacteroidota bacterium]|nr:hypothetical protein [Bacteroidota bacterium]
MKKIEKRKIIEIKKENINEENDLYSQIRNKNHDKNINKDFLKKYGFDEIFYSYN